MDIDHPGTRLALGEVLLPEMVPTPQAMRSAMSGFATGRALVAGEVNNSPVGILANSFTSVSLEPSLVSVNITRSWATRPILRSGARRGISVLAGQHEAEFRQLSRKTDRFEGVNLVQPSDGSVFLEDAMATFTVAIEQEVDAGDDVIVLMRVQQLTRSYQRSPVVFSAAKSTTSSAKTKTLLK